MKLATILILGLLGGLRNCIPVPPEPPIPSPSATVPPTPSPMPSTIPSAIPSALPSSAPSTAPSPSPTVSPSSSPSTPTPIGPTDVDKIIILTVAGSPCKIPGKQFIWTVGCKEAFVTATPKQDNGRDAEYHSRNLFWMIGHNCMNDDGIIKESACVDITTVVEPPDYIECTEIWSQGQETLFNKWFAPKEVCQFKLWVGLQEPKTVKHPTGWFWQMRDVQVISPR